VTSARAVVTRSGVAWLAPGSSTILAHDVHSRGVASWRAANRLAPTRWFRGGRPSGWSGGIRGRSGFRRLGLGSARAPVRWCRRSFDGVVGGLRRCTSRSEDRGASWPRPEVGGRTFRYGSVPRGEGQASRPSSADESGMLAPPCPEVEPTVSPMGLFPLRGPLFPRLERCRARVIPPPVRPPFGSFGPRERSGGSAPQPEGCGGGSASESVRGESDRSVRPAEAGRPFAVASMGFLTSKSFPC
jgi:hypothetical protein